jgi:hypothetical protein
LSLDGQRRFLTIRIKSKDRLSLTRRITTIDRLFSINPRALPASSAFAATASSQRRRRTRFTAVPDAFCRATEKTLTPRLKNFWIDGDFEINDLLTPMTADAEKPGKSRQGFL